MREMVREWFGAEREFTGNAATQYGTDMEPRVREFYELIRGVSVVETDSVPHPDYPFISVSPDGLVGIDGCVEFKAPYYARQPYTLDEKPYYRAQVQLVLETLDLIWCDFLCWFDPEAYMGPGSHYHIEREMRDRAWFRDALPRLEKFHESFMDIVSSKRKSAKYLRPSQEKSAEPVVDPRFVALRRHLAREMELKAELTPVQEAIRDLRQSLGQEYGNCTDGEVIVEVIRKKGAIDYKKMVSAAMEVPEIAESLGDPETWRKDETVAYSAKVITKEDEQ